MISNSCPSKSIIEAKVDLFLSILGTSFSKGRYIMTVLSVLKQCNFVQDIDFSYDILKLDRFIVTLIYSSVLPLGMKTI
jgi:hypothetical protein